jgi:class 3 adenylate cyclase/GTPase SAR1 family protein
MLATGSFDRTVRLWDDRSGKQVAILEGHTDTVRSVSFSADQRLLASKSFDGTVRLWNPGWGGMLHVIPETASGNWAASLAFHPSAPLLATLGNDDAVIRIWEVDTAVLLGLIPSVLVSGRIRTAPLSSARYANAKVVLVGDTGVGKSGLGLVLCGQSFTPTESTHGRHVWVFDSRQTPVEGGRTESREILLWDLAGQPGYRLIHQLHLGEVAVALIIFDARSETDALAGVRHWERALRQARQAQGDSALPLKKFLVAARADRGGAGLSAARIETLVSDMGFDGYFETSAKEGWQVPEVAEAIRQAIDWDTLPRVSSTELFQRIKVMLLEEKKARRLLSTTQDLYRTFLKGGDAPADTEELLAQFGTCIGRVESQGLIRRLSFGDFVLLQPELLDAYASALINAAKDEPDGLGSIAEEDVRAGRFRMPTDQSIPNPAQEKLLLLAMIEDLLRHDIALREQADDGTYLVFPSQLTREYPDLTDPEGKAVIFAFEGPVLNVYATLAVRLARSGLFKRKEMWKNAATYTATVGGMCGVFLREVEEGRGELTLLFDPAASKETRFQFEDYIHTHLKRRALPQSIQRRRILVCSNPDCATPLTDLQVRRRLDRGFDWIECNVCGEQVTLTERKEPPVVATRSSVSEMDRTADAHRDLEAGLVSASGEMGTKQFRDWAGAEQTMLALVFTDIVESTALSNELGNEAMNEARRAHFERGGKWLQKHGGYEIKTVGDSLMVAFRTAVQALNFALAFSGDTGHERLRIRIGLHVGLVHIEKGDAYGAMVNYTARVQSQAQQPEIWLSDRAKEDLDQVKAKAHRRLRWTEHPGCVLKGFPGTHRLWSVVAS